jgi:hypothetical protein
MISMLIGSVLAEIRRTLMALKLLALSWKDRTYDHLCSSIIDKLITQVGS